MAKNKYDRKSKKVFKVACDRCKVKHEILEGFAHYFKEFQANQPGAVLTCPKCLEGRINL